MTRKSTRPIAFTAMIALFVLLVVGFGEAFTEIFDAGEWQMTTLEFSELSETYDEATTSEGQFEKISDQSDTIDYDSVSAKIAYLDAFEEVIQFQ